MIAEVDQHWPPDHYREEDEEDTAEAIQTYDDIDLYLRRAPDVVRSTKVLTAYWKD